MTKKYLEFQSNNLTWTETDKKPYSTATALEKLDQLTPNQLRVCEMKIHTIYKGFDQKLGLKRWVYVIWKMLGGEYFFGATCVSRVDEKYKEIIAKANCFSGSANCNKAKLFKIEAEGETFSVGKELLLEILKAQGVEEWQLIENQTLTSSDIFDNAPARAVRYLLDYVENTMNNKEYKLEDSYIKCASFDDVVSWVKLLDFCNLNSPILFPVYDKLLNEAKQEKETIPNCIHNSLASYIAYKNIMQFASILDVNTLLIGPTIGFKLERGTGEIVKIDEKELKNSDLLLCLPNEGSSIFTYVSELMLDNNEDCSSLIMLLLKNDPFVTQNDDYKELKNNFGLFCDSSIFSNDLPKLALERTWNCLKEYTDQIIKKGYQELEEEIQQFLWPTDSLND